MNDKSHVYQRDIERVWTAKKNRISPTHQNSFILEPGHWEKYDPFLMLAEDWFQKGSFDVHPHRGIETVTYVMQGKLEHYDNKTAGKDELLPGDAQWMTAGRGVIHKEDPAVGETVHSLQLWVNLPSSDKMTEPRYQNLRSADMPLRVEEGVTVRVFSGSSNGVTASTKNVVPITMVELNVDPGASVKQDLPGSYNGFLYVLEGEGLFGRERTRAGEGQVLWLGTAENSQASEVEIMAVTKLHALLYAGQPLNEPVVANGPFVMNTQEQIRQAYQDYRDGKFV
ncbi:MULTISPECIES: pirin family protein [unclassified Paenibacillus]|uniref:pirin family protein n=1 Tax=unclassified Paenibacillus TaxID=185978 RepID=UPI001AE10A9C|nr:MULTISPECIES: pirin family protein [unclassified Paenibacillus]MBP1154997.1 redox-sensitive bicupin YhaK (pirin superfamily) [Paenibacillus sp. PvP091]MBP1169620.1 redox-sensitive bicupin YhaK (pirin superfamily) [Paenibacillus sp. PvR098]MBP2440648.1 redox-sensitive bicupin YhaK (pirin superfamily) [Paenibacillus sp. PvP052]